MLPEIPPASPPPRESVFSPDRALTLEEHLPPGETPKQLIERAQDILTALNNSFLVTAGERTRLAQFSQKTKEQCVALARERIELRAKIAELEGGNGNNDADLEAAKETLTKVNAELTALKEDNARITAELKTTKETLVKVNAEKQADKEEREKEKADYEKKIKEAWTTMAQAHAAEKETLKVLANLRADLDTNNKDNKRKRDELEEENRALKAKLARVLGVLEGE